MGKASTGSSSYWTKGFALADDFEDADGKSVLTFHDAQDAAKKLARGGDDGSADSAPITVDGALTAYKTDLTARSANPYNAEWPRVHLTSALLSKPVAVLAATELKKWRDGLLGTMAPSTINRLCACLCAALEQAAQHDKRIQNRGEWEIGLASLPNAQQARNVILSDAKVREFVASAYRADDKFGLLTDMLAVTGARPSQAVRLRIEDLRDHPVRPKLMMPKSAKGGDRNRAEKKLERYSVPITVQLAARLREAARARPDHAPLLLQGDGSPWPDNPGASYHREVKKIVADTGADPDATMYVRALAQLREFLCRCRQVPVMAGICSCAPIPAPSFRRAIADGSAWSTSACMRTRPIVGASISAGRIKEKSTLQNQRGWSCCR